MSLSVFGFTKWAIGNLLHLSIPFCDSDIPVPLVDVAPDSRDSEQSGEGLATEEA
jgi:hypothetical protein